MVNALAWIARHMGHNRDLRWWDIPTWAPQWQLRPLSWPARWIVGALVGWLSLGPAIRPADERVHEPRALDVRWPTRTELHDRRRRSVLVFQYVLGLAYGPVLGLQYGLLTGNVVDVAYGLPFGLGMLTLMLVQFWDTPLATAHAVGPLDVYRSDQRRTVVFRLVGSLVSGLMLGSGVGLLTRHVVGFAVGFAVGLVFGLAGRAGPSAQLTVVQMTWRLRGQRVRFIPLLQTALDRQILRQAGAVYQFRHAALQNFLQNHDPGAERVIDGENPDGLTGPDLS